MRARRVPASPATRRLPPRPRPAPSSPRAAACARPRPSSPEPTPSLARALSPPLWGVARGAGPGPWVCALGPHPQDLGRWGGWGSGGPRGGATRGGRGRGGGARDPWPIAGGGPNRKEAGRSSGPSAPAAPSAHGALLPGRLGAAHRAGGLRSPLPGGEEPGADGLAGARATLSVWESPSDSPRILEDLVTRSRPLPGAA